MTPEQIDVIYNKLQEINRNDLADLFMSNPEGFDYSVLESDPNFVESYKNVADFIGDKSKIKSQIYTQLDGKFPTQERFEYLQEQYPWLTKAELKEWFDKTNEYKTYYTEEAKKEGLKNLRKKEVADWGFLQNLLASEYEKQRYIEDPQSAIFGKQASGFWNSSPGAKADLAAGIAGGVADALPGVGKSLIGPGIRTSRDVAHKVTDSPYQKDWTQIGRDAVTDVGTNLGAALLFNARKGAKMASNASDPEVKNALEAVRETAHIKAGLPQVAEHMHIPTQPEIDFYRAFNLPYPSSDRVLRNTVNDLADSDLKHELMSVVNTDPGRPINRAEVQRIYQKYLTQTQPGMRETVRMADDYMRPLSNIGNEPVTQYLRNAADAKTFNELNKYQKAQYLANKAAMAINSGAVGQIAVQEGANLHGRGNKPNVIETALQKAEKEATINRLISSYSLLWNTKNKPQGYNESPLIKAAYDKWKKEQE